MLRTLLDWSGVAALIPLIIGLVWGVADEDVTSDITLSLFANGIGVIFTVLALVVMIAFWANFARIAEVTEVLDRYKAGAFGVIAIAGLAIVKGSDGGWILFGISQLGVAYVIYKTHLLPTGFGIASAICAAISIVVGIIGLANGGANATPVFVLIGWSLLMTVLYLNNGHPEELSSDIPDRILSSRGTRASDG